MKKNIFFKGSLVLSICLVGLIAIYSLVTNYHFPPDQLNYFFSLFYLILALNFLGEDPSIDDRKERIKLIFTKTHSILISCVLAIFFSLILIQAEVTIGKIFIILVFSLVLYCTTLVFFKRGITLILFWINFYLFMGVFGFSQFPNFPIDLLSRFNPFAGLIVSVFA